MAATARARAKERARIAIKARAKARSTTKAKAKKTSNDKECYVCGKKVHLARDCWSRANHDKMANGGGRRPKCPA